MAFPSRPKAVVKPNVGGCQIDFWQVDPLLYLFTPERAQFGSRCSYGFEPTFFGHAAGALVVLVMGPDRSPNPASGCDKH